MFSTFVLTMVGLLIALYLQSFFAARAVRRNRPNTPPETAQLLWIAPR